MIPDREYLQSEIPELMSVDNLLENIHSHANIMPMMGKDEMAALIDSLKTKGQLEPITLYRGKVIDGRNRLKALEALGEKNIKVVKLLQNPTLEAVLQVVLDKEVRRKQSKTQLGISALLAIQSGKLENKSVASRAMGISTKQILKAEEVQALVTPEVFKALHDGDLYLKLDGKTTSSFVAIIEDIERRAQLNYVEIQRSKITETNSVLSDKDREEGEELAYIILKGKSLSFLVGVQIVLDERLGDINYKELDDNKGEFNGIYSPNELKEAKLKLHEGRLKIEARKAEVIAKRSKSQIEAVELNDAKLKSKAGISNKVSPFSKKKINSSDF